MRMKKQLRNVLVLVTVAAMLFCNLVAFAEEPVNPKAQTLEIPDSQEPSDADKTEPQNPSDTDKTEPQEPSDTDKTEPQDPKNTEVMDVNIDFVQPGTNGEFEEVYEIEAKDVSTTATLGDILEDPLPEGKDMEGLKFLGWMDMHGNPVDENTPVKKGYSNYYARYEKLLLPVSYVYYTDEQTLKRENTRCKIEFGSTYRQLVEQLDKELIPDDMYNKDGFIGWRLLERVRENSGNEDKVVPVHKSVILEAVYKETPVAINYEYFNTQKELVNAVQVHWTDIKNTVRQLLEETRKWKPDDILEEPSFKEWNLTRGISEDVLDTPISDFNKRISYTARYNKKVLNISYSYTNERGEYALEDKFVVLEDDATYGDMEETIRKNEINTYPDLEVKGWDLSIDQVDSWEKTDPARDVNIVLAEMDADKCLVRYVLDDRWKNQAEELEHYVCDYDVQAQWDTIICQVVEPGTLISTPETVVGFETVSWVRQPNSSGEDIKDFEVNGDVSFYGYGVKKPIDEESPIITDIQIDRQGQKVEAGDTVTLTVKATDNDQLSDTATATFTTDEFHPEHEKIITIEMTLRDGVYTGTYTIPEGMDNTEWYIQNLEITDVSDNIASVRKYNPDFRGERPYYFYVAKDGKTQMPTREVNLEIYKRDDQGLLKIHQTITKENVPRRATVGEMIGGKLPVLESFKGVKFIGWEDVFGNPVDENSVVIAPEITLYPKFEEMVFSVEKTYYNSETGYHETYSAYTAEEGTTFGELLKVINDEPLPDDLYNSSSFVQWNCDYWLEAEIEEREIVPVKAEYSLVPVPIKYEYIDQNQKWVTVDKLVWEEPGQTYQEFIDKYSKSPAEDNWEKLNFTGWRWKGYTVNPEQLIQPYGEIVRYEAHYAEKTMSVSYSYFDKTGREVKEYTTLFLDDDTTYNEVLEQINKKKPDSYEGLIFERWDTAFTKRPFSVPLDNPVHEHNGEALADAVNKNYLVRHIIDDRCKDEELLDDIYGKADLDWDTILCQVVEPGTKISSPAKVEGYDSVTWVRTSEYGSDKVEETYTVDRDLTIYGYGEKTAVKPDPKPEKKPDPKPSEQDKGVQTGDNSVAMIAVPVGLMILAIVVIIVILWKKRKK